MILVAVYFNYEVPEKENQVLRDEKRQILSERKFKEDFFAEMLVISKMIDSLGVPEEDENVQDMRIRGVRDKLYELTENIPPNNSTDNEMYRAVTQLCYDLLESKNKVNSLREAESEIEEWRSAYEKIKIDLDRVQYELDTYRKFN